MSIPTPNSAFTVSGLFIAAQILAVIIIVACIDHPVKWGWLVLGTAISIIGHLVNMRNGNGGIVASVIMAISLLVTCLAI